MPRLSSISLESHDYYKFPTIKWFPEAINHKGLARGGIYLLSGPPGCGKTTLALQMMVDLASCGHKILYITLEQTPGWLKDSIQQKIFPYRRADQPGKSEQPNKREVDANWRKQLKGIGKRIEKDGEKDKSEERVEDNLFIDSSVPNMESLPDFLIRQVIGKDLQYNGTKIIVIDSLQGLGTAPSSSRPYAELYKFNRWAKDEGITCILIGHVTKAGKIAGPRSLEHNVDCVMYMRTAMRLRPFFIPKNRYGPERHEPFSLIMNKWGCLEKSKHMRAHATTAYSYLSGRGGLVDVQALVKLPKFGVRPGILAPYLPRQRLQQIIGIISSIKDVDISDLTFEINCYLPGGKVYSHILDFPIAMSILSSYFQLSLPNNSIFVGELDLSQRVRPLPGANLVQDLASSLSEDQTDSPTPVERIFISEGQRRLLIDSLSQHNLKIEVVGVSEIQGLMNRIWPDITGAT